MDNGGSRKEGVSRIALFSVEHKRQWKGYEYCIRRVMRLTERTIDKKGQQLLTPEIDLEGWWTRLTVSEEDVIQLYADHATSEQFHGMFKTDLDIERLPSGTVKKSSFALCELWVKGWASAATEKMIVVINGQDEMLDKIGVSAHKWAFAESTHSVFDFVEWT
jgi:hypothetical protein